MGAPPNDPAAWLNDVLPLFEGTAFELRRANDHWSDTVSRHLVRPGADIEKLYAHLGQPQREALLGVGSTRGST